MNAWEPLWDALAASGWSLGHVSYQDPHGVGWLVDAAWYDGEDARLHVADASDLGEAVRMVAAKIAAEEQSGEPESVAFADWRKPVTKGCAFSREGSCVVGPEDAWEWVSGQAVRCRYRFERMDLMG